MLILNDYKFLYAIDLMLILNDYIFICIYAIDLMLILNDYKFYCVYAIDFLFLNEGLVAQQYQGARGDKKGPNRKINNDLGNIKKF